MIEKAINAINELRGPKLQKDIDSVEILSELEENSKLHNHLPLTSKLTESVIEDLKREVQIYFKEQQSELNDELMSSKKTYQIINAAHPNYCLNWVELKTIEGKTESHLMEITLGIGKRILKWFNFEFEKNKNQQVSQYALKLGKTTEAGNYEFSFFSSQGHFGLIPPKHVNDKNYVPVCLIKTERGLIQFNFKLKYAAGEQMTTNIIFSNEGLGCFDFNGHNVLFSDCNEKTLSQQWKLKNI